MASKGVIGIEFDLLEEMIRNIVRQEVTEISKEVKQALISKRETLLQEERLSIDQVAEILDRDRRTVYNYINNGTLPEPKRDLSDHPYWTPDQVKRAAELRGIMVKFPV